MRDFLVLAILLGSVPLCLLSPYFGVLMWYWVAYFNPHRFAWHYAYNFPAAAVIAVPTLVGMLFARKTTVTLWVRETVLLAALWIWCGLTYVHATSVPLFAGHMADAQYGLARFSKILLLTFVMALIVNSRERLRTLLLVTASSIGLLAVKGMLFGIRTTGQSRVFGPPDSFLADNNSFALAVDMTLPIMFFLAREEKRYWVRAILRVFFFAGIGTVILTYSRGGLLGLAVVLSAIAIKTRRKALSAVFLAVGMLVALTLAPAKWMERMEPFFQGELDQSASQRLIGWKTAWNFALDYPITGGGFGVLPDEQVFQQYQPEPLPGLRSQGPHSIYFEFLADHGFIGLGLFLFLLGSCLASLRSMRRTLRHFPQGQWITNYSHMIEISLLAYMSCGAFLGRGYFDLAYQLIVTVSVLKVLHEQVRRESSVAQEERVPAMAAEEVVT